MTDKKFTLDRRNGKVMGVCAGLANYTGLDVTLVRVAAVVITVFGGFPWTLVAYGAAAWLAKSKHCGAATAPALRMSTRDMQENMRDIDRRLAEVDSFVAVSNSRLSQEIEQLR